MKYLTIGEFAKEIGVSTNTLRNWDKSGKLVPHHKTVDGNRFYTMEQAAEYLGIGVNLNIESNSLNQLEDLSLDELDTMIKGHKAILKYLEYLYSNKFNEVYG